MNQQITFEDGFMIKKIALAEMEHGERLTKGVPNGIKYLKVGTSRNQADLESGEGERVVMPDGQVMILKKSSSVDEFVPVELIRAKAEAKFFRGVVASIKKRTGLSSTKVSVPESQRLTLLDLREWVEGKRQLDGYDFDAVPSITQDKVIDVIDKLANPSAPKGGLPSSVVQLVELWDSGVYDFALEHGKITQTKYDSLKSTVEAHKKRIAGQEAKKAAEAAKAADDDGEPVGSDEV